MICPYCYEECGALSISPAYGLICNRCLFRYDGVKPTPGEVLTEEEKKILEYAKDCDT